jgi:ribonucleases P/MRP protein subunit RPP40
LLYQCIKSFLSRRFQSVRIGTALSSPLPVISGVPQGSVLGPFLFLLYINDLPDALDNSFSCKLFADDLKAYDVFNIIDGNDKFQYMLNSLVEWTDKWQMSLSVSKCGSLLIASNSKSIDDQELMIRDSGICCLNSVKDLGVVVDASLNFSEHIDNITSKAKQRIYLLLRSFRNRNINLMVFAFKVYILPLLEYCSTIWSPYKLNDIDRIEKVQRSFTKRLEGLHNLTYSERLAACNLPSLELRRLRSDLILCFKIVHNLIALNFSDFFEFERSKFNTRGHKFKLRIPKIQKNVRKNFFSIRIIPSWNHLPNEVVSALSVMHFKKQLMTIDLSKFLLRNHDNVMP